MYTEQLREKVLPPSQSIVGVYKQITPLILYYINYRQVTLLKITDAPIQVSDIFDFAVSFKFINFSFQTFPLFVPEMSNSFTFYTV
jgi:hypothetical protein